MIRTLLPLLLALAAFEASGCYTATYSGPWGPYGNSVRNLTEEPVRGIDRLCTTHRLKSEADKAWDAVRAAAPPHFYTPDYGAGFRMGFADYVEAGGKGEPPGVPPACYRLDCYKNPEGYHAAQDWFAGFRHGAAVAMHSGLREAILVPVSSVPETGTGTRSPETDPAASQPSPPSQTSPSPAGVEMLPPQPTLPPPRRVPLAARSVLFPS